LNVVTSTTGEGVGTFVWRFYWPFSEEATALA